MEEARKKLKQVMPVHMRPAPQKQELRPYEQTKKEEEEKKAMAIEAQKKQSAQMQVPTGKQQRGMLFGGRKKQAPKGFEGLQKDTKVG